MMLIFALIYVISLQRKEFSRSVMEQSRHVRDDHSDICSGQFYRDLQSKGVLQGNYVTLTFNTDGIQVFHSSGYSFWPLYLTINELPFHLRYDSTGSIDITFFVTSFCNYRFTKENRIFAGLWYGSSKPDMTLFLKPMASTLTKLSIDGKYIILYFIFY